MDADCTVQPLTPEKKSSISDIIDKMADKALRTLLLAHKDFTFASELPKDWRDNPPDQDSLCCDCVVGIIDPLRDDVKEAVSLAQAAGVTVRMVTGDNVTTACAIARQCGIMTSEGVAIDGPTFRKISPHDVDLLLPKLQVMARSSPHDKFLLVTRLNGHAIPNNRADWERFHKVRI